MFWRLKPTFPQDLFNLHFYIQKLGAVGTADGQRASIAVPVFSSVRIMIQNIVYHRFLYGIPLCLSHGGDHCVYRCLLCHKAAVPIEFGIYIIRVGPLVDRLSQQIKEILLFFLACGCLHLLLPGRSILPVQLSAFRKQIQGYVIPFLSGTLGSNRKIYDIGHSVLLLSRGLQFHIGSPGDRHRPLTSGNGHIKAVAVIAHRVCLPADR